MSDYNFLMESRLSPAQLQVLTQVSRLAGEQGLNIYLVGGAVRDLTYGQQIIADLDFAVEGNPQKLLRRLKSDGAGPVQRAGPMSEKPPSLSVAHAWFDGRPNSAEVIFSNGVRAEIAMTRKEVYSKPGRRPEIFYGTIFDDLRRRDFSINAMAVSLHPNSRGLLLDPTNGVADIEKRELRVLHSRSFLEDPRRIYRILRLGLRLNFRPAERTRVYLESALENRLWLRLDPDQQERELAAILHEENPQQILKMYAHQGLLAGLDKKLSWRKIAAERFAKIRSVVNSLPGSDAFLLNAHCLVEKFGSAVKTRLIKKVVRDPKSVKMVLSFDPAARKLARALASRRAALPTQTWNLLSGVPQPLLLFLLVRFPQPKIQNRVKNFLFKYPSIRARLPRAELQALGMKPGPKFEKVLERVFFEQLDGKIKTPSQLLRALREYAGIKEPPPTPPKPPRRKTKR